MVPISPYIQVLRMTLSFIIERHSFVAFMILKKLFDINKINYLI
jgi:hypothetical protein